MRWLTELDGPGAVDVVLSVDSVSLHLTCFCFPSLMGSFSPYIVLGEKFTLWSCYCILWAWWSGRKRKNFLSKQWSKSLEPGSLNWVRVTWYLHTNPRGQEMWLTGWFRSASIHPDPRMLSEPTYSLPWESSWRIHGYTLCPAWHGKERVSKVSPGPSAPTWGLVGKRILRPLPRRARAENLGMGPHPCFHKPSSFGAD